MDKNQATGLLLFAAVILVYSLFFASGPEPLPERDTPAQAEVPEETPQQEPTPLTSEQGDSAKLEQLQSKFGAFASLALGEEKEVVLENDDIKILFSTKGAEIKSVELKGFSTFDGRPLILLEEDKAEIDYSLSTRSGEISLNDFYFEVEERDTELEETQVKQLVFTGTTENGSVQRIYTLPARGYELQHKLNISNLGAELSEQQVTLRYENRLPRLEEDLEESRRKTYMNFYTSDGKYDYLTTGNSEDQARPEKPLHWVAYKQRFFTSAIIADGGMQANNLFQDTDEDSDEIEKVMQSEILLPLTADGAELRYYFGPNNYNILRRVAPDFDKNVDMGYFFVSWVNKYIIVNLFHFLEKYFNNYGVIIILIVFIIKLFLLPLTYKSYIGMAKMRVIKPEIDELKEKYGDDPTKMQQEQMKLFGQLGVSPISGCLPMVLQMPFLLAMFFFFPNSIELRQESFLWAHDLSTYDSIINLPFTIPFYGAHVSLFTLLMTVSQLAYTHFNNQLTTAQGPMKNIGYIMPVVFMFVLNSFPAALSFYYFVSNMVTFGQQALIKQFVDDGKIRQKVEETKAKNANKKKSKFQMKLEEAMKVADQKKDTRKKKKK
ncbi:membrane protein insertase YidC [Pleomorphovibrio marinus]|uniref:membrane protein insertase YidC n=1 Tax=Pleomorphovibrio marinus TaxID=2164132 RepID=UPI000E0B2D6D|nr:membrane protein insertase YidC [Pleomorphovibrio marinus]